MYKINIDTVAIHPFNDETVVECSYKDFAFYCIQTFETVEPSDSEMMNYFISNTHITPDKKKNFTPEQIQSAFTKMIERKKEEFMKMKDFY
jgi:hypothetical protein